MAAPEIPSVKISRSLKLTDHRIALGHDHHTKENAEKAGADTKGPNVQRVGGSRLSGAAGYSSATMSSFGPRLSLGFPPTRLGARRFGADDWGMQSQRIGHTQKATKPKSGKLRSESGKKRTDLTQPPRRPESPYLSRPFSQPNTRPVSRETHTSGNLKAPASLSRPPSTPTTRGKTKTTRRPSTKWGGTTPRSGDVSLRPSTSRGEASAKEIRTFTNIDACGDGGGFFSTKGKRPPSAQDAHIEENAFGESRRRDPIQEVDPPSLHERDAVALPTETEGEESGGLADSYGMTLGEYISNMRTTPALGSSFSGLQSERWASIPMDSSDLVDGDSDGEIEIVEDVESLSDTSEQFNGFGEVEKPEPGTPR
ncbi:hypothetical protein BSKO_11203 [Bryopsis sp. KO-2023]|nr:hypothetical protein BSKO_11203 [Bryopsis sp. KO-2023]